MGFEQVRKNKEKQNNQNTSKGGIISKKLMNTHLMQQKAKEHQAMFGNAIQREKNKTGLPDNLKSGMESLSGMSLDHIKVHYNSTKPASVQAHAYAQGSDIHLASGQEKHLPHELGHVVQQAEGRVKPTANIGGVAINDNQALESEATRMGERALQMKSKGNLILKQNVKNQNVLQGNFWTKILLGGMGYQAYTMLKRGQEINGWSEEKQVEEMEQESKNGRDRALFETRKCAPGTVGAAISRLLTPAYIVVGNFAGGNVGSFYAENKNLLEQQATSENIRDFTSLETRFFSIQEGLVFYAGRLLNEEGRFVFVSKFAKPDEYEEKEGN